MEKPKKLRIEIIETRRANEVLKEALEKGNWFEGVVLAKEYLENYAYYRLRNFLGSKRVRAYPFLKGMRLSRMAWILKELRIINDKTYSMIAEVNSYRNKILHEYRHPEEIKPKDAKRIIRNALKCLEAIVSTY